MVFRLATQSFYIYLFNILNLFFLKKKKKKKKRKFWKFNVGDFTNTRAGDVRQRIIFFGLIEIWQKCYELHSFDCEMVQIHQYVNM